MPKLLHPVNAVGGCLTVGHLLRCLQCLPEDTTITIAIETWADPEDPHNRELKRLVRQPHFIEIRPRTAVLSLVYSEPEEGTK